MSHVARLLIEVMAKHLPPSTASLRLLDIDGAAGNVLKELRADLNVIVVSGDPAGWSLDEASVDAVVAFGRRLDDTPLPILLAALRPGGRLIVMDPAGTVSEKPVLALEAAGYTRILVEDGITQPAPIGLLMRGEKPHTTADTRERIQQVAGQEGDMLDLRSFKGRYVHLLVVQTPNKPVWALAEGERYTWQAVTFDGELLAFSSLPKAVGFMQPAVVEGLIRDVNKVGKFSKETAATWTQAVLLNPSLDTVRGKILGHLTIDPDTAEAPDE